MIFFFYFLYLGDVSPMVLLGFFGQGQLQRWFCNWWMWKDLLYLMSRAIFRFWYSLLHCIVIYRSSIYRTNICEYLFIYFCFFERKNERNFSKKKQLSFLQWFSHSLILGCEQMYRSMRNEQMVQGISGNFFPSMLRSKTTLFVWDLKILDHGLQKKNSIYLSPLITRKIMEVYYN